MAVEALGELVETDAVDTQQFLALTDMKLTPAAHEWLLEPVRVAAFLNGKRTDHELVDDLERGVVTERHRSRRPTSGRPFIIAPPTSERRKLCPA